MTDVTDAADVTTGGRQRLSRRSFLGGAGAGAAAVALSPLTAAPAAASSSADPHAGLRTESFGRLFRLPPFADQSPRIEAALTELGRPGGLMDAHDDLGAGPVALIVDPSLSENNRDNPTHTAGTTFFGQFIAHDITFDAGSRLGHPTNPQTARNFRSPSLDLDAVYGAGPVADAQLYQAADHVQLRVESGGRFEDLPRTADGRAILGDPRNDENVVLAGMHAAFLIAHNRAVDDARASGADDEAAFAAARQLITWHYQWLVLHEFLPQVVGQQMVTDVLHAGGRAFQPKTGGGFIPVEFQGAAFRMGHSMIRPSYRANFSGNAPGPFFGFIFDEPASDPDDPDDLRGGVRADRRFIGWSTFFDFGDGLVRPNKRMDTTISTPLFHLPIGAIASGTPPVVLPQRTLLRHLTWLLPSGQAVAAALGAPVLAAADLAELTSLGVGFESRTPLWYYLLKEAEVMADGLTLGPAGGRIVAEVLIGLLRADPTSFLSAQPSWQPTLGPVAGLFRMVDLLTYAGVDPASRAE